MKKLKTSQRLEKLKKELKLNSCQEKELNILISLIQCEENKTSLYPIEELPTLIFKTLKKSIVLDKYELIFEYIVEFIKNSVP